MARPAMGYFDEAGNRILGSTSVLKFLSFIDSDALCGWAASLAKRGLDFKRVRQEAGHHGSILHELCEFKLPAALDPVADRPATLVVREPPANASEKFKAAVEAQRLQADKQWDNLMASYAAIREWFVLYGPQVVFHEEPLVSREHGFAGTPDAVATFPRDVEPPVEWMPLGVRIVAGRPWLFDYKSGKTMGAKEVCQMASYRVLLKECRGIEVDGAILVHAPTASPGYMRPIVLPPTALDLGWECFRAGQLVAGAASRLAAYCEE